MSLVFYKEYVNEKEEGFLVVVVFGLSVYDYYRARTGELTTNYSVSKIVDKSEDSQDASLLIEI